MMWHIKNKHFYSFGCEPIDISERQNDKQNKIQKRLIIIKSNAMQRY